MVQNSAYSLDCFPPNLASFYMRPRDINVSWSQCNVLFSQNALYLAQHLENVSSSC